jgi:tryptophan-rich sensory protein
MPAFHPEAFLFCLAWAALAIAAAIMGSLWAGILFSAGLALVLMPLSATIIHKTESLTLERQVRWGLLVLAALALAAGLAVQSSSSS